MRGCLNGGLIGTILWMTGWAFWEANFWFQAAIVLVAWVLLVLLYVEDRREKRTLEGQIKRLQRETAANLAEGDRVAAMVRDMRCPHCGKAKV